MVFIFVTSKRRFFSTESTLLCLCGLSVGVQSNCKVLLDLGQCSEA